MEHIYHETLAAESKMAILVIFPGIFNFKTTCREERREGKP